MTQATKSHFAMFRGAIALAWADHELDAEEQERLEVYIDHNTELSDAQKAQLKEDLHNHITLDQVWDDITDVHDRAHLINIADAIFWEDGQLCHTEREVLDKMNEKHMATLDIEAHMAEIHSYRQELANNRKVFEAELQQTKEEARGPLQRMLAYLGVFG